MDLDSAKAIVSKVINSKYYAPGDELVIVDEDTIEKDYGWIFFYNSREFLETGEFSARVAGNGPIVIEKADGRITQLGTARPSEEYIREFELERGFNG